MKKSVRYFLLSLLSIVGLLGLGILLSVTVFKDQLVEYIIEQDNENRKLIQSYFVSELPVEPETFAEDFQSIHDIVSKHCPLCSYKDYDIDSLSRSFASRIEADVMTKTDYGLLLREYFAALNIGHAGIMLSLHSAEYYPTIVENRIFINNPNQHFINS